MLLLKANRLFVRGQRAYQTQRTHIAVNHDGYHKLTHATHSYTMHTNTCWLFTKNLEVYGIKHIEIASSERFYINVYNKYIATMHDISIQNEDHFKISGFHDYSNGLSPAVVAAS